MGDVRADLLDDTWYSGGDEGSIVAVIHDGVPGRMPENTDLTAEQLQAVVRYVQALRHEHEAATTEQPF
jgi:mono/diheme cytochrome c family protein